MNKKTIVLLAIVLLLAVAVWAFFFIRDVRYDHGRERGYDLGYATGYADGLNGKTQNSQTTAGRLNPYAFGGSSWKGFMMGFPAGYDAGYQIAAPDAA